MPRALPRDTDRVTPGRGCSARDKGGEERSVGESRLSRTQLLGIPALSGWEVALSSQDACAAGDKETGLIREWNKQSKRRGGSGGGSTGSCYSKFGVALNTDPSHDGLDSHSIQQQHCAGCCGTAWGQGTFPELDLLVLNFTISDYLAWDSLPRQYSLFLDLIRN